MNSKDILIGAALVGAWYVFTKTPGGTVATTYPPGTSTTDPLTKLLQSILGKPAAGGSSGGGISGGGGVPGGPPGGSPGYVNPANISKTTPTGPYDPCSPVLAPGCPGYVDSEDPCDLSSTAYDAFTCACSQSPFPGCPGYVDTEDPCDMNSTAYDAATCQSLIDSSFLPSTTDSTTDSGDPCDPASVAFDPWACSGE